jgi:acyl-CoA synthetase (AMP-forming)/AMP-acid ligase II
MFLSAFERRDFEHRTAIIFHDRKLTYGEIAAQGRDMAARLQSLGIGPGDRVGLHFRNSDQLIACYLACYWSGAILVPLRWSESPDLIISWCNHLGTKCLIADDHLISKITSRVTELPTRMVLTPLAASRSSIIDAKEFQRAPNDGKPLFILHTSGSTAMPKAAMQDLDALNARARIQAEYLGYRPDDVVCAIVDFTHGWALHGLASPAWGVGAAVMMFDQSQFDPAQAMDAAAESGATIIGSVPMILYRLVQVARDAAELPRLRFGLSSGDRLPDDVALEWERIFGAPLLEAWGMTEGCVAILFNRLGDHEIGTVGRPLPGVSARIVDANGEDVPSGQIGELWLKTGKFAFSGYWNDPEKTQQAFQDGWLKTGDQFLRNANNRYRFVSRAVHLIKRGGLMVSAAEIESALMRHPSIAQCVAIGVPSGDEWGQNIEAFVKLRSHVTASELHLHAAKTMRMASCPTKYWSVASIPETHAGKISRNIADYAATELLK